MPKAVLIRRQALVAVLLFVTALLGIESYQYAESLIPPQLPDVPASLGTPAPTVVGIARNDRLAAQAKSFIDKAGQHFQRTGRKQRRFHEMYYAAGTWDKRRRIIVKAEHTAQGSNPRYLVTNLKAQPKYLYDQLYCARGEAENRIKEQQLDLFADRTSCHAWWPNQFRLLLSSLAYTLLEALRRLGLNGTKLANAYVGTIRLKLLKIGAVITRNTRRIRFLLSSAYPYQDLFAQVTAKLQPT